MRLAVAATLILIGGAAMLLAWGSLQNLFGYRDSPVSTYLLVGLPFVLLAALAFGGAWQVLKR